MTPKLYTSALRGEGGKEGRKTRKERTLAESGALWLAACMITDKKQGQLVLASDGTNGSESMSRRKKEQ